MEDFNALQISLLQVTDSGKICLIYLALSHPHRKRIGEPGDKLNGQVSRSGIFTVGLRANCYHIPKLKQ
jgi:hypothetical protein